MAAPVTGTTTPPEGPAKERAVIGALILTAMVPLVLVAIPPVDTFSPSQKVVDVASWLAFVGLLAAWGRSHPGRMGRGNWLLSAAVLALTFPWYLVPGISGTEFLGVFRLVVVVRVWSRARRGGIVGSAMSRVGSLSMSLVVVSVIAAALVVVSEPPSSGFRNLGDALWWAMVTFTTVGYGDLVPVTAGGRFAAVLMMFAGVAALGSVAALLGSLFRRSDQAEPDDASAIVLAEVRALRQEVAALRAELDRRERS